MHQCASYLFASPEGFTLLEILVALALLGIALLVIVQLFSTDLRGISVSDDYVVAVAKAESRMRELLDDDTLSEKDWSEFTDDGYRIDASVRESLKDRTENLQVRLFYIGLAVHWRKGERERFVTLNTLKVMNKEVGL
jgi:prepilin-type N-terminal cleavage/methylation domain-containing protein